MNDFEGLQEFVAVVDAGSFSAASRKLGVSVSHVSRQVALLEEKLGAKLLQRTTRAVTLTEVGALVHRRAAAMIGDLKGLADEVMDAQGKPRGLVRISAGGAYGERFVAPALVRFAVANPEISIDLHVGERRVDLVREGFDLAVRHGALVDSSLIARRINPRNMRLAAAPAYLEAGPPLNDIPDLAAHSCLVSPDMPWRLKGRDGERVLRLTGRFQSTSGPALVEAALAGLGIIWLAEFYVREHLASGALRRLLPETEIADSATWIVYPARDHMPSRTKAVIDWLVRELESW